MQNDGFTDMDEAEKAAFILCDNLYRRIEGADTLPTSGIKLNIPATGNLAPLTPMNLNKRHTLQAAYYMAVLPFSPVPLLPPEFL